MVLCSYVNYIDQGLSTFFKKCIFGSVLSDVNDGYLLMMLCEIIDRIGFEVGGIFKNLKNFFGIFYSKNCIIFGFGGCFLVYVVKFVGVSLHG